MLVMINDLNFSTSDKAAESKPELETQHRESGYGVELAAARGIFSFGAAFMRRGPVTASRLKAP